MCSAREKHIDIRRPFVLDVEKRSDTKIVHLKPKVQHAGLLTNNLNGDVYRNDSRYVMNLT